MNLLLRAAMRRRAGFAALLVILSSEVAAQTVGVPAVAEDHDKDCLWRATLIPNPPVGIANTKSSILDNAFLSNPSFKPDSLAFSLDEVDIKVEQYFAWVTTQPAVSCGPSMNAPKKIWGPMFGGAVICVDYTPPPSGEPASIHWLQVGRTNGPPGTLPGRVKTVDGFSYFIDNGDDLATAFYDLSGGAATGDHFLDVTTARCLPNTGCNTDITVTFDLFAVQSLPGNKILVYRNGIEWGYNFHCEPFDEVDQPFEPAPEASTWWGAGFLTVFVSIQMFRTARRRNARLAVSGVT